MGAVGERLAVLRGPGGGDELVAEVGRRSNFRRSPRARPARRRRRRWSRRTRGSCSRARGCARAARPRAGRRRCRTCGSECRRGLRPSAGRRRAGRPVVEDLSPSGAVVVVALGRLGRRRPGSRPRRRRRPSVARSPAVGLAPAWNTARRATADDHERRPRRRRAMISRLAALLLALLLACASARRRRGGPCPWAWPCLLASPWSRVRAQTRVGLDGHGESTESRAEPERRRRPSTAVGVQPWARAAAATRASSRPSARGSSVGQRYDDRRRPRLRTARAADAAPAGRQRAVGRRRAARSRDGAPGPSASAAQHRLAGAEAEHVRGLVADQGGGARAVLAGGEHEVAEPAHARATGRRASLPFARSPRAGDLVGHRRSGHREQVAVAVDPAGVVVEDLEPGGADAMSVWPLRQARPRGVADDDGDVDAGELAEPLAQPAGRRVGVLAAAARSVPGSVLEASMPAPAITRPWRVRTIAVGPRRATTRSVSAGEPPVLGRRATTRPSALLTTLLVTTTTSPSSSRPASRPRRARPGRRRRVTSPMPSTAATWTGRSAGGHARPASAKAAAAMAAVASWSVIISGTARQRDPGRLDAGDRGRRRRCRPASRRARRRVLRAP